MLQSSLQQPTSNLCASLGCFVCTLAAMATRHAMSGLDFCANHCREPTSVSVSYTHLRAHETRRHL
eukprot:7685321-Prorocentrum_lima.AAC.1